jgi:hypothetical protein
VGGVSTRVQEAGPPGAQTAVVFVHGSPDSSRDWDDLVAAGGRFARTVAIGAVLIDTGVLIDYVPHPLAVVWSTRGAGELQMASTTRDNWRASFAQDSPRGFPAGFVDRLYDDYDRATRCAILRYYRSASQSFQTIGRDQAAVLRPRATCRRS